MWHFLHVILFDFIYVCTVYSITKGIVIPHTAAFPHVVCTRQFSLQLSKSVGENAVQICEFYENSATNYDEFVSLKCICLVVCVCVRVTGIITVLSFVLFFSNKYNIIQPDENDD